MTGEKRKSVGGGLESTFRLQTRRRLAVVRPENSASPAASENSTCTDHDIVSCCLSNGSNELAKECVEFVDLEEECGTSTCDLVENGEKRETGPCSEVQDESGELESTARPHQASSRHRSTADQKMPSKAEIEEFFASAEENLQRQFTKKYNFDFVKEEPLEGRYEWVQIKP